MSMTAGLGALWVAGLALATADKAPVEYLPARLRETALARHFSPAAATNQASETLLLEVPLNWADPEAGPRFDIRYHVDASYFDADDPTAPIFVTMGGEGTSNGVACSSIARAHKALCVGVEHRFYGLSLPSAAAGGASTENYQAGLSVEQNLADTAAVIDRVQADYPGANDAKRPVINQGGSYSGSTCSFFRQAYPDHTAACVSSSGVVNTLLDFFAFDEHVDTALHSPDGAACPDALRNTTLAMERLFRAGRGDEVKAAFNASNLAGTPLGDDDFWYAVADAPAMMDQYGDKADLCQGLATLDPSSATDMERVENLAGIIQAHYGSDFMANCFYDSECLRNVTNANSDTDALNGRSWRWQKCSQVAFLQRAPDQKQELPLRSTDLTLDALLEQCDYVFGDGTADNLRTANAEFLAKFGGAVPRSGAFPNTTNVFYEDFSDDPWVEASVGQQTHPTLPYCMTTCDGCGHCGAGVPADLTECSDKAAKFIAAVLRRQG